MTKKPASNRAFSGSLLSKRWGLGAEHALYHSEGTRYHNLQEFPGALCDPYGYVLFKTEEDYRNSPYVFVTEHTNVRPNIAAMPGYVQVVPRDGQRASDIAEPEIRKVVTTTTRIVRDTAIAQQIKDLYENCCQICGYALPLRGDETYAEAHHIKPLGFRHNGSDVRENIICVCPNHHAQLDYGAIRLEPKKLTVLPGHDIGNEYVHYHNSTICGQLL